MTVAQAFRQLVHRLAPLGAEAEATARIIFEDVASYDRNYIFVNGDRTIEDFMTARIGKVADAVLAGMPVQYAVGKARFMGYDFEVTPDVLIPRPETEGLVDLIADDYRGRSDLRVLDVCTGSGCIAISLARMLPFARVDALDLSAPALDVARRNNKAAGMKVDFFEADALAMPPATAAYDIIVSNPPYVCENEKAAMQSRVLDYEPAMALFVPDDNPLLFYKAIATYAVGALAGDGTLYFEINPLYATRLRNELPALGFGEVDIIRDYRGAERFAKVRR